MTYDRLIREAAASTDDVYANHPLMAEIVDALVTARTEIDDVREIVRRIIASSECAADGRVVVCIELMRELSRLIC